MILNSGEQWEPSSDDMEVWSKAYPGIDVGAELRKMDSWCHSNPARRKTKRGVKKFINSWLSRAQPASVLARKSTRDADIYEELTDHSWAN